jgi:hypothetical protein
MDGAYSSEIMGRWHERTWGHEAEGHNYKAPKMPNNAFGKHVPQISLVHNQLVII